MPSSGQVQENGYSVTEIQKKMLEKIEEMTLYILQLEKKNQELEKRINNLETQE